MRIPEGFVRFSLASGATLALLAGIGGAALAKEVTVLGARSDDVPTESVLHRDLNLASAQGAKALMFRVSGAVRRVCAPQERYDYTQCRQFAWNGARPQMDRAIARAQQLAATGTTSIPAVAIVIATPR